MLSLMLESPNPMDEVAEAAGKSKLLVLSDGSVDFILSSIRHK